jgi:nucleotide-binding universal stress UspA family protein
MMIERVVVPVDFTAESEWALIPAIRFAEWSGTRVELVSVVAPSDRRQVEHRLAMLAATAGRDGADYRIIESDGPAEPALVDELRRRRNALWCLGSHARSAVGEMLRYSVSEDLVRDAHVPVVLVGPNCTTAPSGRVLAVALDGTEHSEAVIPNAVELATSLGMTVRLLQVGGPARPLEVGRPETEYLATAARKVPAMAGGTIDSGVLRGRHPAHELADYVAMNADVGLVATATRGLSGVERLRHGGSAFELAHRAVVPVAVAHFG